MGGRRGILSLLSTVTLTRTVSPSFFLTVKSGPLDCAQQEIYDLTAASFPYSAGEDPIALVRAPELPPKVH